MLAIQPPTHCPSCGSGLTWKGYILYCTNSDCGSKRNKVIEHFTKTMRIKGFGPATIEKLDLSSPLSLYTLTSEEITDALGSEKIAEKLLLEIENSKTAPLNMVLPAFGISLIGKTATEKLSATCNDIFDITDETCSLAGLGPKATENLLSWLEIEHEIINLYPFDFKFIKKPEKTASVVKKGIVCISGKLKSFKTKREATDALENCGYEVKSSLTKAVSILINESGIESAKTQKARESGVTIVTNLTNFLGEN